MKTEFETFWMSNGYRIDDFAEVEKLVESGVLVKEISSEMQAAEFEAQQKRALAYEGSVARYEKLVQEAAFRASPEGRQAEALREAAAHGGSRVTIIGPQDPAIAELDQYGPAKTDVFKR